MSRWNDPKHPTVFEGLAARSQMIECPLGSYSVRVRTCSGIGECAAVCPVGVFGVDSGGRCTVFNEALCFGCMACVAQCAEKGVEVAVALRRRYQTPDDLLR